MCVSEYSQKLSAQQTGNSYTKTSFVWIISEMLEPKTASDSLIHPSAEMVLAKQKIRERNKEGKIDSKEKAGKKAAQ